MFSYAEKRWTCEASRAQRLARDGCVLHPSQAKLRRGAGALHAVQVAPQPGNFYGGWVTSKVVGPFKGIPGSMGW